jgi:nicotinamidase-related amidase
MRDQWNSALYPPLDKTYQEALHLDNGREDVWIHKNRMSGLWGTVTMCTDFLEKQGIRTLLFAGVNTDQCVGASLQDAFSKGYDCIMLSDGCGTTSPDFAQDCVEYNGAKTWGFVLSCEDLAKGVDAMK